MKSFQQGDKSSDRNSRRSPDHTELPIWFEAALTVPLIPVSSFPHLRIFKAWDGGGGRLFTGREGAKPAAAQDAQPILKLVTLHNAAYLCAKTQTWPHLEHLRELNYDEDFILLLLRRLFDDREKQQSRAEHEFLFHPRKKIKAAATPRTSR